MAEDVQLVQSWLAVSQDLIIGNEQMGDSFSEESSPASLIALAKQSAQNRVSCCTVDSSRGI
jgi:hypothetical protein